MIHASPFMICADYILARIHLSVMVRDLDTFRESGDSRILPAHSSQHRNPTNTIVANFRVLLTTLGIQHFDIIKGKTLKETRAKSFFYIKKLYVIIKSTLPRKINIVSLNKL